MKLLLLDIEVAPNLATVWGLFKQNIAINQLLETSYVLCFAAKWYGEDEIIFRSLNKHGKKRMLKTAHTLLSQADGVITYNGQSYDVPILNREFVQQGWHPPAPFKHVDLLKTVRKNFRFVSNKLDHVSQQLKLGSKLDHEGHTLWLKVMNGDKNAWATMESYNVQDIKLLEKLYERVLPWVSGHPSHAITHGHVCPNCGSDSLQSRGETVTKTLTYRRYQCTDCGTWSRSKVSEKTNRANVVSL